MCMLRSIEHLFDDGTSTSAVETGFTVIYNLILPRLQNRLDDIPVYTYEFRPSRYARGI